MAKNSTENALFCIGLNAKKIKYLQSPPFLVSLVRNIVLNPIILLFNSCMY